MPSSSKKQHNFMAAVANNPSFAKKAGVPQSVGKEFNNADKGKTFKQGGDMKPVDMKKNPGVAKLPTAVRNKMGFMKEGGMAKSDAKEDMKMDKSQDKAMIKKAFKQHDAQEHKGGKGTSLKLAKGGAAKYMSFGETGKPAGMKPVTKMASGGSFRSSANGVASKGKTKGTMVKMNMGGKAC
jgi:hypothetical protein